MIMNAAVVKYIFFFFYPAESLSSCEDEELCTFIPGSACDEESINRKCPKKCNACPGTFIFIFNTAPCIVT